MVAAGVGAALNGMRPVVDLNFIDFSFGAMDEIVNQAAKMRYMFGTPLPLVIRGTSGVALYAAQHNNSLEAGVRPPAGAPRRDPLDAGRHQGPDQVGAPGRRPRDLPDAQEAQREPRRGRGADDLVPFGRAAIRRPGSDVTIVTYSHMVLKAMEAAAKPRRRAGSRRRSSTCAR